jgi:hypothetical protein
MTNEKYEDTLITLTAAIIHGGEIPAVRAVKEAHEAVEAIELARKDRAKKTDTR